MGPDTPEAGSIRASLDAAFDSLSTTEAPAPAETTSTAEPAPIVESKVADSKPAEATDKTPVKAADGRDDKGRFSTKAAKTTETPAPAAGKTTSTPAPAIGDQNETTPAPVASGTVVKAPSSWTPAAREEWAKVPASVQAEVMRVDKEVRRVFEESAEAKKNWNGFREAVAPYEAMVRAEGSDPVRAAVGLMQQAQLLRTAPPQVKAQFVAQLVNAHGVDIEMLAQYIDGRTPQGAQQAPQQNPQQYRDPEFQEFKRQLQATVQRKKQEEQRQASQEIQSFADTHEFFDDVGKDVADILELGRRRGLQLSLEDAYNRAVRLDPGLSKILEQREAAKAAANAQASTQRAKAAAASVRPEPAAQGISAQPKSLRASLDRAFDDAMRK